MRWIKLFPLLLAGPVYGGGPRRGQEGPAYRNVAYFGNWAAYKNFTPQDLPVSSLTHVIYAFADVKPETGEVFLSNTSVDTGTPVANAQNNTGHVLGGYLQQLFALKQKNRNLKVLLSVGGWAYSPHFAQAASNESGRRMFAASVVSLIKNLGLDGVDIDWEYPATAGQGQDMLYLVQEVRGALSAYGRSLNPPYNFILTVAGPAWLGYRYLPLSDIDRQVDFWNLMAYDYTGPWSNRTGDFANVRASLVNPKSTPFSTAAILEHYTSQNISLAKILLGIPLYGRSFSIQKGLSQPLGQPFTACSTYDFKDLPLSGSTVTVDPLTISSHSYNAASGELVVYDTSAVANLKATWIKDVGLGGAMYWEGSGDGCGNQSVIWGVGSVLRSLENVPNCLYYPNSTYSNIAGKKSSAVSSQGPVTTSSLADPSRTTTTATSHSLHTTTSVGSVTSTVSTVPSASPSPACTGETCGTYVARDCSGDACSCALDADQQPVCVLHNTCEKASVCSTDADCNGNKCVIKNCCADGKARCLEERDLQDCLGAPLCKRLNPGWNPSVPGDASLHC